MLTESLLLSVAGALAASVLADWGSRSFSAFILGQFYVAVPASLNLSSEAQIFAFIASVAVVAGLLFGLAPAWRATHENPSSTLQQGARAVGEGSGGFGRGLIVTQIALSVVLLTGAGLFIRSLEKLHAVQPGFQTRNVMEVRLFVRPHAFENADRSSYFGELTQRVSNLPGVISAGMEDVRVGSGLEWKERVQIHGRTNEEFSSDCEMAMPGFFRTLGISLLQGRSFTWADDEHAPRLAILSENLAKEVFPSSNAVGQSIDITTEPKWQNLKIVGIASNARLYDLRKPAQPTVYLPTLQYGDYADDDELLIRSNASSAAILPSVRRIVDGLGRHTILYAWPLSENIDRSLLQERITAMLSAFFGALALLIAGIGLFGLMANSVTRRTREIGIGLALGAARGSVIRMILRETVALTLVGIAIGLPCAIAIARLIAHMLFGVAPYDPTTVAAVALGLVIVGAVAGYIPARRAMRVDPMVALR